MGEKPIIFSGPMVEAILDGRKTQTRRIVKPHRKWVPDLSVVTEFLPGPYDGVFTAFNGNSPIGGLVCPFGDVGTRLWVRETFAIEHSVENDQPAPFDDGRPIKRSDDPDEPRWRQPHYRATDPTPDLYYEDGPDEPMVRWKSPISMPRWASRITLEIIGVRVERLQSISEADAIAEGIQIPCDAESKSPLLRLTGMVGPSAICDKHPRDWTMKDFARLEYAELWESINGRGSWAANPFVWAIEFRRIEP